MDDARWKGALPSASLWLGGIRLMVHIQISGAYNVKKLFVDSFQKKVLHDIAYRALRLDDEKLL